MERPGEQDTPSAVRKALGMLDAFDAETPELSIRELARRSGVARSTAHRLVGELLEWGALERTTAGVRLGMKLFELGSLAPTPVTLRDAALPFAHHLHEVTQLTVNVAVRSGGEIVYLEKITSRSLRVPHSRQGGRGALHATGLGKAILAFGGDAEIDEVLAGPLAAITPKTITDPETLRRELARVRERRVAYDVEESRLELFCVAAPILDARGRALGAISVTGATALDQAERFAPAVATTALAVAGALRPRRPDATRRR
ncbi:IclR family transcriptional regulator [Pseudolysinimonas sp.]|jgi:IclR family acetate operon transcriptional repressor|uniref:IclR family transcriptional regulator n=1 Tax=Pseudolysinimonas sp. TaxID=2680009 RepID=UPI003783C9EB